MTDSLTELSGKLSEISAGDTADITWPDSLDRDQWFMSPQLISLYGTPLWHQLSVPERKKLSFFETVNLFSLNIHGEKALIQGMAKRMYRKQEIGFGPYLHNFVGEENEHMEYFAKFCLNYAGKIYADKKLALPGKHSAPEEDFLFFARVMIFEEIVDTYNMRNARDETLEPLARQINCMHHRDEARHLAFGRKVVLELFQAYSPKWDEMTLAAVRAYLCSYLVQTLKEYYNPDVYKDAGIMNPFEIRSAAINNRHRKKHRQRLAKRCTDFLINNSILLEVPAL